MPMSTVVTRLEANAVNDHFVKVFGARGTWNAPSAPSGGKVSDTIAVPGVLLGDVVLAVSSSLTITDLTLTAYVSAANVVTVVVANNTGGAIDLAAADFRVVVARIADFPPVAV